MRNALLDQMQQFLELSNIDKQLPEIRKVKNVGTEGREISIFSCCNLSSNQLSNQPLIAKITIFTALDILVDNWYPALETKNFITKCKELPFQTNREKAIRNTYRIMKIIRNSMVHNVSGCIGDSDNRTVIEFGKDKIVYHANLMKYLNTIVMILLRNRNVTDKYIDTILSAYYNLMLYEIIEARDSIGEIKPINCTIDYKPLCRYRIDSEPGIVKLDNGGYKVLRYRESGRSSDEFLIKQDDDCYIIPGEILGDKDYIFPESLHEWRIDPKNSFL